MKKWLVGLVCVGMLATAALGQEPAVWFNEINYDPAGSDTAGTEWLEVAGPAGTDLSNYVVVRYNGANGASYGSTTLSGTIDDEGCGFGAVELVYNTADSLQNGAPDGVALANVNGGVTTLVQFLCYEGTFMATNGPAAGATGANIGTQNSLTNLTLQLNGSATNYGGFTWVTNTSSMGSLNAGQTIAGCSASPQTNVSFTASAVSVDENAGTYQVNVVKSLAEGDVSGQIALSGTATYGAGEDYTVDSTNFTLNGTTTSAVITVTINDDEVQEAAETVVLTLAGVAGGTVVTPSTFTLTINSSDIPTHAIAIVTNAPANGTVTTSPAGSAQEGATVTVSATPVGGYAVQSIVVNGGAVTVTGNTFVMPTSDVTVTVTFVEAATSGDLIISQYYEGTGNNKWVEIYNPGATAIDLAGGGYRLGLWANTNREGWKVGIPTATIVVLSNSIPAGGTYLVRNTSATNPAYATANQASGNISFTGDDSVLLYTGTTYDFANVVDAFGCSTVFSNATDKSYVRKSTVTVGVNTDFNAADWDEVTLATVDGAGEDVNERLGYHSTGAAVFSVSLNRSNGFTVEQGASDSITATAANGTAPYGYSWSSTLGGAYYAANSNVFTILATAPIGDYSATVTATDDAAQTASNTVTFSVTAPVVKYGIAIVTNAPANGTVTTTPATEAAAGATVTVNAIPAGGYAVQSIVVNGGAVTVTGNTFTMPAEPVTVTVTFAEHAGSSLFISEVADPSNNASAGRFIELYNAGVASVDLAAGNWFLARQSNGGATWGNIALTGTVAPGGTYVIAGSSNFPTAYPSAPAANQTSGSIDGNGDDGYFLFSGGRHTNGVLEDAYGVIDQDGTGMPWEYTDRRAVRQTAVTVGNPTWTASEWTIVRANAEDMTPGVHPDGPVVFSVALNRSNGFTVEQGASDSITATAANGTAPYGYSWSSTLGGAYYTANSNVFTILATAPTGSYSATVTATDDAAQTASNTVTFSVTAPAPKYAISIVTNAPANGTVTTTPATEAAAGATVTVNAIPAGGYAVESIVVNGGAVTVTGTAFTMPAEPATVTVTFMEYTAPDVLIDFEDYTGSYAWNEYAAGGVTWTMTNVFAGNTVDDAKNGTKAGRFENNRGGVGNPATMTSTAFTAAVTKITFWYANYGVNDGGAFKVQVSDDGSSWTDVGAAEYNPDSKTLTLGTIDSIPAGMTHVQFITTAGSAQRVNIDDIGIFFGAPALSVSVNRSNGFTVEQGQSDSITATAANGTGPYVYAWASTLGASYRTTNGNVFTILATAPTGSYSVTVTATDATLATAQKTVTFSVVGLGPGPAVIIAGSRTGTVGVPMNLTISVTNETANDWFIDLKDPTGADAGWDYSNFPPTFSLTPTMTGTYVLAVTAETGSGNYSNTANLVIGAGGGGNDWQIGNPDTGGGMFYSTSNQTIVIVLPTNYTLTAVYGTDSSGAGLNNLGQGLGTTLTQGVDYNWNPATRTISVLSGVTNRRVLRIGASSP